MTPLTLATTITVNDSGSVTLGPLTLDPIEARAVLVRLSECVGRPMGDWVGVRDRLDRLYAGALPVTVRDLGTGERGRGMMLTRDAEPDRADLRLSDFATAVVTRTGPGKRWSGFVVQWGPDSLVGMVASCTGRRVAVSAPRVRRLK